MNTLAELHGWVVSQLEAWSRCVRVVTLEMDSLGEQQFRFKVRAHLDEPHWLQVRLYFNHGHVDYSYQLFTDLPVLRWDNKEDFPDLANAPHHFHNEHGQVLSSSLNGMPEHDWPIVRDSLERFLVNKSEPGD